MADTLPPANLPPESEPWRRAIEEKLAKALKDAGRAQRHVSNVTSAQSGIQSAQAELTDTAVAHSDQLAAIAPEVEDHQELLRPAVSPPSPTSPVLSTKLGSVVASWDGEYVTPPEGALGLVEVYAEMSTVEPYEGPIDPENPPPSTPWVRVGQNLTGPGDVLFAADVGSVLWFRLTAVNGAGASPPSDWATITITGVEVPDLSEAVQDILDEAVVAAGNATTIDSIDPPSVDGRNVGDTWRRWSSLDATGTLQGIWRWDGAGWVQTALIVDGSIVARHLNVDEIWADTAFVDSATVNVLKAGAIEGEMIAADAIDGKTITGATVQTNTAVTTGVKLDSAGFRAYNTAGEKTFEVTPDGDVTIGGSLSTGSTFKISNPDFPDHDLFVDGYGNLSATDWPEPNIADWNTAWRAGRTYWSTGVAANVPEFLSPASDPPNRYFGRVEGHVFYGYVKQILWSGGRPDFKWERLGFLDEPSVTWGAWTRVPISVPATAAEVQAGTDASRYISPAALRAAGGGDPPGSVQMFAGATAPAGWLLCDGSAVSRTTYADLFAAIGTTFGAGNGSSTFNLPNLKGRVPVGVDAAQSEFNVLGETGGEKVHTLTESEMPAHNHNTTFRSGASGASNPGVHIGGSQVGTAGGVYAVGSTNGSGHSILNLSSKGGGDAHNNLQPYMALNYIIKT